MKPRLNMSIDTDLHPQEAASPHEVMVRSSLRYASIYAFNGENNEF